MDGISDLSSDTGSPSKESRPLHPASFRRGEVYNLGFRTPPTHAGRTRAHRGSAAHWYEPRSFFESSTIVAVNSTEDGVVCATQASSGSADVFASGVYRAQSNSFGTLRARLLRTQSSTLWLRSRTYHSLCDVHRDDSERILRRLQLADLTRWGQARIAPPELPRSATRYTSAPS